MDRIRREGFAIFIQPDARKECAGVWLFRFPEDRPVGPPQIQIGFVAREAVRAFKHDHARSDLNRLVNFCVQRLDVHDYFFDYTLRFPRPTLLNELARRAFDFASG